VIGDAAGALADVQRAGEEALRREHAQLLSILGGADQPIYIVDPATQGVLYHNAAAARSGDFAGGSPCRDQMFGAEGRCPGCPADPRAADVFGGGQDQVRVGTIVSNRTGRTYEVTVRRIRWPDGRLVLLHQAFDVSEKRRAEQLVRESMTKYRAMFDHALDAVLLLETSREGAAAAPAVTECNAASIRLFGAAGREALRGLSLDALSAPAQAEGAAADLLRARLDAARAQGTVRFEWRHRRVDGSTFPAEVSLVRLDVAGPEVFLVMVRDVTERERAEFAARERQAELARRVDAATADLQAANAGLREQIEERLRTEEALSGAHRELDLIFQAATGGMRVVDLDFNVVRANRTFADLVGLRVEQIVGRKCWEVFAGDACHTERCTLKRLQRGEKLRGLEVEKRAVDGAVVPCLLDVREMWDERGRLSGFVSDFRDVSETRRLHSIAEAVNTADNIGFAFSGIRHELGNPVNAVKTTLTVLRRQLEHLPQAKITEYVDRALSDLGRMEYLLRFLKSYNQFETPAVEPVDLRRFFERLGQLLAADVERQGVALRCGCEPAQLVVRADPRALQQVFLNLVANAIDALAGRPSPAVVITARDGGRYAVLEIADNGRGMSVAARQNLFKPFFTSKPRGTGLGLVIVKKMLAKMGGTIEISSAEGEGTKVVVSLEKEGARCASTSASC
jgi:PAS domain S-box-containing protein